MCWSSLSPILGPIVSEILLSEGNYMQETMLVPRVPNNNVYQMRVILHLIKCIQDHLIAPSDGAE